MIDRTPFILSVILNTIPRFIMVVFCPFANNPVALCLTAPSGTSLWKMLLAIVSFEFAMTRRHLPTRNQVLAVAGSVPGAARMAAFLREQSNRIIGGYWGPSCDLRRNGELDVIRHCAPGARIIIDVGANQGDWTAAYLEHGEQLVQALLLEPIPMAHEMLVERFAADPRVKAINVAAGEAAGEQMLFQNTRNSQLSTLVKIETKDSIRESVVKVVTLDDEATRHGFETIDFIKIDTEGYDFHVIRGCQRLLSRGRVRLIQFEYNKPWALAGSTLGAALVYLASFGFTCLAIRPGGLYRFDYSRWGDYFRLTNFLAVHESVCEDLRGLIR